jgi:hypothetical protein
MNWDAIGAISEVVGSAAVVFTLIYLAVQIRQNTKSVQSAALEGAVNTPIATRQAIYESAEMTNIINRGMKDHKDLDEDELFRFRLSVQNTLWGIWNIHAQSRLTGLSNNVWEAQKPFILRMLLSPGGAWFWRNYKTEFERSFVTELDQIVKRHVKGGDDVPSPSEKK